LDATVKRLRARAGGLSRAARYDGLVVTARARQTFRDSFLDQVPCDLPESERARRAEALRKLHYTKMALKSAVVRSKKIATASTPVAISPAETGGASGNATAAG
jgi:hypothetical protein